MILAGTGLVHFRDKYLLLTLSIRSRHCLEPCHIVLRWWIVATVHFIALIFPDVYDCARFFVDFGR